eukprot:CAMPEP_0198154924 /NCGR_PEP_ID=MMETSP1443-20131203/68861_1 /TAXON_ID=186043 /ORGANISM="Entomoneis sp., Strain CCMP2396" /LENGTH=469 /DNA_ID=CAMNT_0043821641 /DNA_START=5 /DNA_END=1414 /DNA_ORIENTATION=+
MTSYCQPLKPAGSKFSVQEAISELHRWLHVEAMDIVRVEQLAIAYGEKMNEVGVPVDRVFKGAVVVHPQVGVMTFRWEKESGMFIEKPYARYKKTTKERIEEGELDGDEPLVSLAMGAPYVRIKGDDPNLPKDCEWMKKDGYVELYGLPSVSQNKTEKGKLEGGYTWSTKQQGGFTEEHIEIINGHLLDLCTVMRYHMKDFTMETLLKAYLGEDAGSRVHGGEIERGDGLIIRSVIWFSDIRGFTKMSGELTRHELLEVINGVFEVTERVVRQHGGQILKFMGDGIMVIFADNATSFQRDSFSSEEKRNLDEIHGAKLCHKARTAAEQFQREISQLKNEREEAGLRGASVGVGLHYGDVSYGNVGAPGRLDFTVIGTSVNLASRVESQCSKLRAHVLASSTFVDLDNAQHLWTSKGKHELKGVSKAVELYELGATCTFLFESMESMSLLRSPGGHQESLKGSMMAVSES